MQPSNKKTVSEELYKPCHHAEKTKFQVVSSDSIQYLNSCIAKANLEEHQQSAPTKIIAVVVAGDNPIPSPKRETPDTMITKPDARQSLVRSLGAPHGQLSKCI